MRKGLTSIVTVAALILAGAIFKVMIAPSKTVANVETSTISTYDLDVGHPNMKNLPVQEAPLP